MTTYVRDIKLNEPVRSDAGQKAADKLAIQQGLSPYPIEPAAHGVDVSDFLLDVVHANEIETNIADSITGGKVTRTMTGASTLEVTFDDQRRALMQSGIFSRAIDVVLDGVGWRLVHISKDGDSFTLEFEDRVVAYMRSHRKPLKMSRNKVTRAEFIRIMVREINTQRIRFFSPSLHVKQPVAKRPLSDAEREALKQGGILYDEALKVDNIKTNLKKKQGTGGAQTYTGGANENPGGTDKAKSLKGLTVKGAPATPEQVKMMERVLDVCHSEKASARAVLAVCEACVVENEWTNGQGSGADSISFGILQNIPGRSAGIKGTMTKEQAQDVEYTIRSALRPPGPTSKGGIMKLAKDNPSWTPGEIAAKAINGGGDPNYASKCDSWRSEVEKIIDAYGGYNMIGGTDGADSNIPDTYTKAYQFTRGEPGGPKGENSWEAGLRLADEVRWHLFVVGNTIYYVSDDDLIGQKPRMEIDEDSAGIDQIDFDLDRGKENNEVTVTCRADRWFAPPGSVVVLKDTMNPVDGRWLVDSVERDLFSTDTTITLRRRQKAYKEPAPEEGVLSSDPEDKRKRDAKDVGRDVYAAASPGGGKSGKVYFAPGANVQNGRHKPMNRPIKKFLAQVAGITNERVQVNWGTNHSMRTTSGSISDHWAGNAGDIDVGGDANSSAAARRKGTNIAAAALRALGVPYAEAQRRASTNENLNFNNSTFVNPPGWHGYTIQIGWLTYNGGNHYNHVHIGVAPNGS